MNAVRLSERPIVAAGSVPGYGPIFNAGVIHHDGCYRLFARGVRDGYRPGDGSGPRFVDYVSDVLVFTSLDGHDYAFTQVLETPAAGGHCYEDPRVQVVRDGSAEVILMTYTHLPSPEHGRPWRVGVDRLEYRQGVFSVHTNAAGPIGHPDVPDKDAVVFNLKDGRVALIHRVHPNMQLAVFESVGDLWSVPPRFWEEHLAAIDDHVILRPSPGSLGIGAGAPPVRTEDGLLLFFHEREASGHYTMRVALLDESTGRVLSVVPEPVMRPLLEWERRGDVDNVVFVQGAVARDDGTIYLTYGAADRHVGAATVDTQGLLAALAAAA